MLSAFRVARRAGRHGASHAASAATPPHWLTAERLRVYGATSLLCYVIGMAIWSVRAWILHAPGVIPPGGDSVVFWSAARVTFTHGAGAAYDLATLRAAEVAAVPSLAGESGALPWLYPPAFLFMVLPFALFPYWLGALVMLGGSAAFYLWVLARIVPWREAWLPCVGFPGIAVVLATGQNGLLFAGLAGLALVRLPARPVLAGVVLGLLTVKPQLAIAVPVALLCARQWRALAAMACAACVLHGLSLAIFGPQVFAGFLRNAAFASTAVQAGAANLSRMPTVFALVRSLGGAPWLAFALHGGVAAGALAAVIFTWRKPCPHALRAGVLVLATLLVPAYLYDYDLALLGVGIACLGVHGWRHGWLPGEREGLVLLWLLPPAGLLLAGRVGFQFMPLVLMAALVASVRRVLRERAGATKTGGHAARDTEGTGDDHAGL